MLPVLLCVTGVIVCYRRCRRMAVVRFLLLVDSKFLMCLFFQNKNKSTKTKVATKEKEFHDEVAKTRTNVWKFNVVLFLIFKYVSSVCLFKVIFLKDLMTKSFSFQGNMKKNQMFGKMQHTSYTTNTNNNIHNNYTIISNNNNNNNNHYNTKDRLNYKTTLPKIPVATLKAPFQPTLFPSIIQPERDRFKVCFHFGCRPSCCKQTCGSTNTMLFGYIIDILIVFYVMIEKDLSFYSEACQGESKKTQRSFMSRYSCCSVTLELHENWHRLKEFLRRFCFFRKQCAANNHTHCIQSIKSLSQNLWLI